MIAALIITAALVGLFACCRAPRVAHELSVDTAPGCIDYRPSVLSALLQQGMTFADIVTSPRRNAAYLTDTQQAALMPCASEQAVRRAARRMGVRMPGDVAA